MLCKYSYNQKIHQQHAGVEGFSKNVHDVIQKKDWKKYVKIDNSSLILLSLSWPQLWSWFLSLFSKSLPQSPPLPLCFASLLLIMDAASVTFPLGLHLTCSNQLITASKRAPVSQQSLPDCLIGHSGGISGRSLHRVNYLIFPTLENLQ